MSPRALTFVSGNKGKIAEVAAVLGGLYEVRNVDIDLDEFQGEIDDIARRKCEAASEKVDGFVMVEDTSLCFDALGGLPGPYIKWFLKVEKGRKLGPSGLHQMLSAYDDKGAEAVCAMAFTHGRGLPITVIKGVCKGRIVSPRGPNTFGWDPCFEPLDTGKTFAEMTIEEKNVISHRSKALAALRETLEKN
ncbi:hap-1 [Pristionchus pacificus]|nr:hap-1 [Pristionchus pacificus]|eukprot:PDM70149.1 hap-1 [Pristionchus pacificus]